jgi:iron complex outermembrane receptor protein
VPSWTTLDAGFGYSVSDTASLAWTRGVRLSLNVYNVTDRNPPIVLSTGFGTSAYNANRSNPLGRTGAFTLTKAF